MKCNHIVCINATQIRGFNHKEKVATEKKVSFLKANRTDEKMFF